MKKLLSAIVGCFALGVLAVSPAMAATTTVVFGDTSAGENQPGWIFNRDASTSTPFEFSEDESSIGDGSIHVLPIGSNPSDKFIAEYFYLDEVANIDSISYDFKTDNSADADQFYLNLYTNDGSNPAEFYDCRYDIVPSVTNPDPQTGFTTFTYNLSDAPTQVVQRASSSIVPCPATPSALPAGSVLRAMAFNVGDTNANDAGLEGYLDKVIINENGEDQIFDFELAKTPVSKDDCKKGGWTTFNSPSFKNQGQCVAYVASGGKNMR